MAPTPFNLAKSVTIGTVREYFMGPIWRKNMNKHVLLTLIFGLSILSARAEKPIRALLVTGGCCHDYDRQKLIIPKGVTARADVKWTVIQQGGKTTNTKIPLYEDAGWADGFDIVVHNECFEPRLESSSYKFATCL